MNNHSILVFYCGCNNGQRFGELYNTNVSHIGKARCKIRLNGLNKLKHEQAGMSSQSLRQSMYFLSFLKVVRPPIYPWLVELSQVNYVELNLSLLMAFGSPSAPLPTPSTIFPPSLCSSGCHRTYCVERAGLDLPASASPVLGLKVFIIVTSLVSSTFKEPCDYTGPT